VPLERRVKLMAEREQIRKTTPKEDADVDEVVETPPVSDKGDQLKAELDDLLDEIDDVLETNAEEFVKSYVQKGGQ